MKKKADSAISADDLRFAYGHKGILDLQRLEIPQGSHTLIYGESGCGKSTLLNLICGVLGGYTGKLSVFGTEMASLKGPRRDRFRAEKMAVIFQQFNLIPYLTVRENVALGLRLRKQTVDYHRLAEILEHLQISPLTAQRALSLSHGQQQRVAAARAIMSRSPLILADEPTSALDDTNSRLFLDLLFREAAENNSTVVVVSHDLRHRKRFDQVIDFAKINRAVKKPRGVSV